MSNIKMKKILTLFFIAVQTISCVPNCHAMTPNFRNWGRTSKHKTSKCLRKGNKGFETSH